MKICTKCKLKLEYSSFSKNKCKVDGLQDACKPCKKEMQIKYRKNNPEKASKRNHDYYSANKKRHQESVRKWKAKKYKEDITYKLETNIRNRIYIALKGIAKISGKVKYLGCSIKFFKEYIQQKFQLGMSWDNYNHETWHLDHIIPISWFDLSKEEEIKKAFHYTNLQPMWAVENSRKGNRYSGDRKE